MVHHEVGTVPAGLVCVRRRKAAPPQDPTRPVVTLKTAWKNVRKKAGVTGRWHDSRHTAITDLAESPETSDETRFAESVVTALGLIAEISKFARFSHPRELAAWLGITPSEYSSGDQQHRGHITLAGNRHARRLLIEAAWHYRHAPRRPRQRPRSRTSAPGKPKSGCITPTGTSPTTGNARPVRERGGRAKHVGFLWAAMTDQPLRATDQSAVNRDQLQEAGPSTRSPFPVVGPGGAVRPARRILDRWSLRFARLATSYEAAARLDTVLQVPTRASQSDSRRCARTRRPAPPPTTTMTPTPTTKTAEPSGPLTRASISDRVKAPTPPGRKFSQSSTSWSWSFRSSVSRVH